MSGAPIRSARGIDDGDLRVAVKQVDGGAFSALSPTRS
jgi:hypothetical protein